MVGPEDEYFYYSEDGSLRALPNTTWGGGGMIWRGNNEFQLEENGIRPTPFSENLSMIKLRHPRPSLGGCIKRSGARVAKRIPSFVQQYRYRWRNESKEVKCCEVRFPVVAEVRGDRVY